MIPKKIHYCWFGEAELPELAQKCLASWQKHCPDYEIIRWDEKNYDISKNLYMKQAYEEKKWGFVPDYARLDIIYNYGGIYLDTDVEVIKSLDELLNHKAFMGLEDAGIVAMGLGFGAEPGNNVISKLLKQYEGISFINQDGTQNLTPSPVLQAEVFGPLGVDSSGRTQIIDEDCIIFSKEYFCPKDPNSRILEITPNTFSIHHYDATWKSDTDREKNLIRERYVNQFKENHSERMANIKAEYYTIRDMQGTGKAVTWFVNETFAKIFRRNSAK